ncbi:MAG TPA: LON peptidase substrate-binding domain-containing protein [Marinobacter sp.]|nr:LON peptidase substrate-binding domain-containing protein [Marinobacter sp.]
MTDSITRVPLFPLNSIILPKGRVPLQLFEPRYLDMLSRCLREQRGFVVVLLKEGDEVGSRAAFHDQGTYVRIMDFQQLDNGLLGITIEGDRKVRIVQTWQQPDGLYMGDVEVLTPEAPVDVPEAFLELPAVLQALFRHPVVQELGMEVDFDDARDVGWRLTELLPLDKTDKQRLAECQDPVERLSQLQKLLDILEQGN